MTHLAALALAAFFLTLGWLTLWDQIEGL